MHSPSSLADLLRSSIVSLRRHGGVFIHDWPRFLATMAGIGPYRSLKLPWIAMRNRHERITLDGRGARCEWEFTSDLHLANVHRSAGLWLMHRTLRDWPIVFRDAPVERAERPLVSFLIGHRGAERLPLLQMTLRSIAGQRGVPIECLVIEQSAVPSIASMLPSWVRYVHTSPLSPDQDAYNRSAAFNAGARAANSSVLILHDNDMLCPADYAAEALARRNEGWLFSDLKRFIFYLDDSATAVVLMEQDLAATAPITVVQNLLGGSIAADGDAFIEIGGFDESFVGWGGEDNEFWERAETLGRVYRHGYLPIVHLWHAPQSQKLARGEAPGVRRYHELKGVAPEKRVRRLRGC